jgi:SAM-dependent methyltransferase
LTLPLADWHRRYRQQAGWTESLRVHLMERIPLQPTGRILEVGCGTGAVSAPMARENPSAKIIGLDIDVPRLRFANSHDRAAEYVGGDALRLPFRNGEFDFTFCHYLLLWIPKPEHALREMVRVTRPGGWVAALAEPDYGGRIDYPPPLETLGRRQMESLRRQGADPAIGRRLAGLLSTAGITVLESGVLGAQINPGSPDTDETELEWRVLKEDIGGGISDAEWQTYFEADRAARKAGQRVLFVPTFYAAGTRA